MAWWAHEWEDHSDYPPAHPGRLMEDPKRRCARCGVIQARIETHAWMRKVSERWEPPVSKRCPDAYK